MGILTDRLHKSGFAHQANVLKLLFHIVETGQVTAPLYDTAARPGIDNSAFLKDHVSALIISAFPNLTKTQVIAFVVGLFDVNLNAEVKPAIGVVTVIALLQIPQQGIDNDLDILILLLPLT